MQITDRPSPAGILLMESEGLIWQPLTEAIQRALLLLMSPEPYSVPSDASTCRHPHTLFINPFCQKMCSSLPYYTVTILLASMNLWLCFKLL